MLEMYAALIKLEEVKDIYIGEKFKNIVSTGKRWGTILCLRQN